MVGRHFLAAALAVIIASCGPSEDSNNVVVINGSPNNANNTNPNSDDNSNTTPIDEQMLSERDQAIFDGFTAPADAKAAAGDALALTVEAVVLASLAANGGNALETTGTLTQSGENFTYAAGPNDRLVIAWSEGEPTDIYVSQLDGNFEADSVEEFFNDDHVVVARVVRAGLVDIQVGSSSTSAQRLGGIQGSITLDGKTYEVDLEEEDNTIFDVDSGGGSYESESTLTGTITGPDVNFVVQEDYTYKHVFIDDSVENRSRTTNSRWTYKGTEYAVNNVFIRSAFLNSYPSEFDFWRAEGTISEDGQVVGQVQFEETELVIRVVLVLDSGEKITLREHLKYQGDGTD